MSCYDVRPPPTFRLQALLEVAATEDPERRLEAAQGLVKLKNGPRWEESAFVRGSGAGRTPIMKAKEENEEPKNSKQESSPAKGKEEGASPAPATVRERARAGESKRRVMNRREAFGKTYSAFIKSNPKYPHRVIEEGMNVPIGYSDSPLEGKSNAWNATHLKPLQARLLLGEAMVWFFDKLVNTPKNRRNIGANTFQWLVSGDIDVNSGSAMGKRMGQQFFDAHGLKNEENRAVLCQVMRDLSAWERSGNVLFSHLGSIVPRPEK